MIHALVRAQTPEEAEFAAVLVALEARTRRVADLQAELQTLKLSLARFASVVLHRARVMFAELDRVRIQIEEHEHRFALLAAEDAADEDDLAAIEDAVRDEFAERRERLEAGAEQTRQEGRAGQRERARPPLPAEVAAEQRRLYRDLARRYHPDLARSSEDRAKRETAMLRVNAAYRERDHEALLALHRAAEAEDPAFDLRPVAERLRWAAAETERLDRLIAGLEFELAETMAGDTYGFWHRHEAGEPVVRLLEDDAGRELAQRRKRLSALTASYRRACKLRLQTA